MAGRPMLHCGNIWPQPVFWLKTQLSMNAPTLLNHFVDTAGQAPFVLPPRGQAVRVLRVLPAAAGRRLELQVVGLQANGDTAAGADVRLDGEAVFDVPAMPAEAPK